MIPATIAERRASRLVRAYPRAWRARYGDEFLMLLVDDIAERPRSLTRTVDILRGGAVAYLSSAGLAGEALDGESQIRAGLRSLSFAVIVFLAAAVAVWSQLTIGWQWSRPDAHGTSTGMVLLSLAMAAFALLLAFAAAPLSWVAVRELISRRQRHLIFPLSAFAIGLFVLVDGSRYFGHGWPGTGGHPWSGRDIVPVVIARSCWAATLWITSYWAHPHALGSFPASEFAWMLISPIALGTAVVAAVKTLRRLPLTPRLLAYETWVGACAGLVMAGAMAGALCWLTSGGPDPHGLFRAGSIDAVAAVVMAAALIVAFRAAQRTLAARSALSSAV